MAKKVSRGLGQNCATCSVAVDREGGTEDGGEEVKPKGPLLEMISRGTVHMEVHGYLRQKLALPFVHFSSRSNISRKYVFVSLTYLLNPVRHRHD